MTKFAVRKFSKQKQSFVDRIFSSFGVSQVSMTTFLLTMIVLGGLSYLVYVNQTATGGFDITGIETHISTLEKQNKQLEIEVAELQSMAVIEESTETMGLVATSDIEYLTVEGSTVVQR